MKLVIVNAFTTIALPFPAVVERLPKMCCLACAQVNLAQPIYLSRKVQDNTKMRHLNKVQTILRLVFLCVYKPTMQRFGMAVA